MYSNTTAVEAMRQLFDIRPGMDRIGNAEPRAGIYPKYPGPIVRLDASGDRELVETSWGFRATNKSKKTGNVIAPRVVNNARADKVQSSFFWRFSFKERRCLIPASSYCEWPPGGNPQVFHWFAMNGTVPRPPFAMAGLWQTSKYETKDRPETCETHTMMTTTANEFTAKIHPSRMPVILKPQDYEAWLHGSEEDAFSLLKPFPAEEMRIALKGEEHRTDPVETQV
ncbi:SOS response-associated peptidase [Loktanella sp. Alg231-35]|uniref:SOS response-associated peptidase n=1 Tax=Loktanella sp. Alg231-35 TaxID=1922220 RepID=UPI0022791903|nr:SOS response-associated peptidase [Loktanella sp. Alg231-35]